MLTLALLALLAGNEAPVEVQRPGEGELWSLDWRAPTECPAREQLGQLVQDYAPGLPAAVEPRAQAKLHLMAELELLESGQWHARLEIREATQTHVRQFDAASCDELSRAVALITAVTLDPIRATLALSTTQTETQASPPTPDLLHSTDTLTQKPDPEPGLDAEPSLDPEPDPAPQLELAANAREPAPAAQARAIRFGLGLGAGASYGPTQAAYANVGASFSVQGTGWRWQLDGGAWLPQVLPRAIDNVAPQEPAGSGLGRFWGWWLGTRGCYVPSTPKLEFPLCAGVELGQVLARAIEPIDDTGTLSQLWVAALPSAGLHWRVRERLALTVDAALLAPLRRADIILDGREVQSLTRVGVRGLVGLELRL